jgi:hypothetical protein
MDVSSGWTGRREYEGEIGIQNDPEWFGGFHAAESTYDEDVADDNDKRLEVGEEAKIKSQEGTTPRLPILGFKASMPAEWFQESASGGSQDAWQTAYPPLPVGQPRGAKNPDWKTSSVGVPEQVSSSNAVSAFLEHARNNEDLAKEAAWFEADVHDYDVFGRAREPLEGSARRYLEWEERTRGVKLTCSDPGCIASATLSLLDAKIEEHHHCRLSIGVHATDYDDEYSTEVVEWLSVNGETVKSDCNPRASGCGNNHSFGDTPLFSCLVDYEIPKEMLLSGSLNISGKLSPMVDECPIEGNLLSGVAQVTCKVRRESVASEIEKVKNAPNYTGTNVTALLRCKDPGCNATSTIELAEAARNMTCKLTVKVTPTDFDDAESEKIELLEYDGTSATENLAPGRNPCKEISLGTLNATAAVEPFVVIDGVDVTSMVTDDLSLVVTAKLSNMVDECGKDGFLLDATAMVECT